MSSRSRKAANSTGISYDSSTRAVMTALPREEQKSINLMISSVAEVVRNRTKNEISLVLQYYDYNVSDTIAAFMEDGAESALQAWNFNGTKANKKNKKREADKSEANEQGDASPVDNNSIAAKKLNTTFVKESQNGSAVGSAVFKVPDANLTHNKTTGDSRANNNKPATPFVNKSNNSRNAKSNNRSVRTESVSESIDGEEKMGRGKKGIEKCSKELGRHSLSLQRARVMMNEEIERSEKRLKQSFQELHRSLETRESELSKELAEVKLRANAMLSSRQDSASRLRVAADQADSLTEDQLNELRIDIKHFVSERKFDDDLSRTVFFIRDHERLLKEINEYGEVAPVKSQYTGRRQSLSSTASSLTPSSDPSGSVITSPVLKTPALSGFVNPPVTATVIPSANRSQSLSELAELQQRLHASLRMQGLPTTSSAPSRGQQRSQRGGGSGSGSGHVRSPLANGNAKPTGSDAPINNSRPAGDIPSPHAVTNEMGGSPGNRGRRRRPLANAGGKGGPPSRMDIDATTPAVD